MPIQGNYRRFCKQELLGAVQLVVVMVTEVPVDQ